MERQYRQSSDVLSLTTGGFNTAVGFFSLRSNTTNNFNTAVGAGTLLVAKRPATFAEKSSAGLCQKPVLTVPPGELSL